MTIRWIESRERAGLKFRDVLGDEIPPKGRLYVTEQFHNDWPNHNVTVFAKGPDAVLLKGDIRGFCNDCTPKTLEGQAINQDPATRRQIRWITADAIEPPQYSSQSPSKLRRFMTLFRR